MTQVDAREEQYAVVAAAAIAPLLPSAGSLVPAPPVAVVSASDVPLPEPTGTGVTVRLGGTPGDAVAGSLAIVVGEPLTTALRESPLGSLDVGQALTPALEAAAQSLGAVAQPSAELAPDVVLGGFVGRPSAHAVALLDGDGAVVATVLVDVREALAAAPGTGVRTDGAGLDLLRDVEMEVTVELGRTRMRVRDLLSLTPGAVVELDRAAGSPADLLVNGTLIARGEIVVVDDDFGIRITSIVEPGSGQTGAGRGAAA